MLRFQGGSTMSALHQLGPKSAGRKGWSNALARSQATEALLNTQHRGSHIHQALPEANEEKPKPRAP
jgi:hypothetical protein